ncbi:MAG: hypothetical protein IPJ40_02500 [Saprospirales bacterium]|nr:hypothetical protein [Saprospirales bacterium]
MNNAGTDITSTSVTGDGNLSPGASPGIFAVSGNYTFANSSTFTVEINDAGTAGTDYDQLDATGTVLIGSNVTLSLNINPGYIPTAGDEFIIVKSGTGLSGTFDGLAEGSFVTTFGGLDFYISYSGGDGNDVVVMAPLPGAALSFDGSDDYVGFINSLFDPSATSFTAEAWVKPTLVDGTGHVFIQQNDGTGTGRTFLGIGGSDKFYTFLGGSALSGTTILSAGTWYHVAVTYDGTTLRLFVNGVEEASEPRILEAADGTMILGTGQSGGLGFQGALDEVRFWTRPLCKEEILNNMNCELAGSETGLLAYYQFNQGLAGVANPTETTLQEFNNNYDGTLNNFALTGATSNWVEPGAVTTGGSCTPFATAIAHYNSGTCACELGYYATLDGNNNITACTQCPPGTYCPDGVNQYDCDPGNFSSASGSISCTPCPAGYFQGASGASECEACLPGTYQDQAGSINCTACEVGKYNPNTAATSCLACPEGTFGAAQGQVVCETCEPGSVAAFTELNACADCGNPVFSAPCPTLTPVTVNADPGACSASVTLAIPTLNEDCTRNHALDFGETSDYVSIGNLGAVSNWTIETWFKHNGLVNYENIFHSDDVNANNGVRLEISANYIPGGHLYLGVNGSLFTIVPLGDPLSSDWHHIAIVGDQTNNRIDIYLDGVKEVDGAVPGSWPATFPNFAIGRGFSSTLAERF